MFDMIDSDSSSVILQLNIFGDIEFLDLIYAFFGHSSIVLSTCWLVSKCEIWKVQVHNLQPMEH